MAYILDTTHTTIVFPDTPLIEPDIIHTIMGEKDYVLDKEVYYYKDKELSDEIMSVCDITSKFLNEQKIEHNKDIWYMDLVRYKVDNSDPVDSGLIWHYENMNYPDLITVLCYLRKDESIIKGNLLYKDKSNNEKTIHISTGTTIIMDGHVEHLPEEVSGSGRRDLIIVSFKIH